jgi:beta-lactamase superfamily II metal-dependent hydrolase
LVILAKVQDKQILLTGDARGDKILEGLELTGLLEKNATMHVNILKMPHHGSDRNMDAIFFRRITADHYVFSGNGDYGNPELETFKMLLSERGDAEFTIHLTYPIPEIDLEREKNWKEEQQKEKARKKKQPREDWSPEKHGLSKFFEAHPDLARKVSIVEANKPHVIDLLDGLGY